ncbi:MULTISPECIES: acyl-CoA dehydrogenase family protein [Achromobacter]|jgi:acyl-CoA dehydrogenase|uniref:Acyl-CoA dehydrogenase family protein n=1 Tax=Achromobacter aegrifaciens TaxID=1287736 RepID=A0AAD2KKI3_ACHAE|nr:MULTISPECIES: acyl-CoA dehydrogenase family protein [Achromobacter]MBD9383131.1 acyl-CoA dehydrogenase family protein [Achromobacter sp. ACM02]MBD9422740.1 acyl-CoA dehydrogenase family protein [Achromobacter sp. ACM04]MBD9430182.1 acyl-CoA dehydrogenase family protein [Achromobacter sp. ACM03]MBD9471716.1 acyl-CoA dehydrogenase family protein [Achromobacter sp. ACM01]MDR7946648.1 acyl-CoA dehydrogenase family protein [Achromobacter aegrifaciens]
MALDTETLNLLLDAVRRFVHERLIPAEDELAESGQVPPDIVNEMRDLGLFGLSISPDHGGLGLTMEEEVRVVFELGQTSPAFRSLAGTNIGIGSQAIVLAGTDEQRARYLPKLASGELIGSFALTEPDAGSDAMALRLSAVRDGDSYVLNGTKRYITNAPIAGLFSVMARTAPERRANSISCFLVEAGTPGLTIGKPDKKMGQAGALTSDVVFDNCRVPASALLGGEEGNGFRTSMRVLDKGRLHISALCVGIADRLLSDAVKYAIERKQFGQPIAEFQLIQAMIADSQAELYAARCMVLDAARMRDRGENTTMQAACCKLYATEMVGRVADRAVQIHGGAGYMSEYAVERFYRDVRLFRIFEGTSQIQQLVIARETIKAHS